MRLKGKTAIITGASSGLGKAASAAFASEGANVVMAARRPEKMNEAAEGLGKLGGHIVAVPTDVSKAEQVEYLVKQTMETFGRVEVLINNAAIDYPGPITELSVEQWDEIIGVNLSGVFYASKSVFSIMMSQKSGYIINISSVAGKKGWPNATAYCASKFALTGFTRSLSHQSLNADILDIIDKACCSARSKQIVNYG